jgi:cysteine-S-conjugate beta-lyase
LDRFDRVSSFERRFLPSSFPALPRSGFVSPPIARGSTLLFPSLSALIAEERKGGNASVYGRKGGSTHRELEAALSALEYAEGTVLAPSGLSAVTCALLSCLRPSGHVLVSDAVYEPSRQFCDEMLARFGVAASYFPASAAATIESYLRDNTCAVLCESPGSVTFEILDLSALCAVTQRRGIPVIVDNTWATPLFFNPLRVGADIVVHSGTKFLLGHADAFLGTISARGALLPRVRQTAHLLGYHVSPEECFLALRGLRTLSVRMTHHYDAGLQVARSLKGDPEVEAIFYPALPGAVGHALWQRDFRGASGVFSFVLRPAGEAALDRFFRHLRHFGIGYGWGGFESLIMTYDVAQLRSVTDWPYAGPLIRVHVGLDDPTALITDLADALDRYHAERVKPAPRCRDQAPLD